MVHRGESVLSRGGNTRGRNRVKSERVKAAMVILRQQGRHTGGKPPWGYKVVGPRSNPEKGTKGNRRLAPTGKSGP